jgi:hypothetical protein
MLRIKINGRWESEDFIEVLIGLESLYYKAALRRHFWFDRYYFGFDGSSGARSFEDHVKLSNEWLLSSARTIAKPHERLHVARIQYASPGGFDLVGLGEACKAVKEIVEVLIKFFTEKDLRREAAAQAKIDTQLKGAELHQRHESLKTLKIENARRLLALRHDHPEAPDELLIGLLVGDQDKLIPRIAEGKIVSVRTIDEENPS